MTHQEDLTTVSRANGRKLSALTVLSSALITWACTPALAALGANTASVEIDRQQMSGQLRVVPAAGYSVHEIVTPTKTTVREYVSTTGQVFAVSWQGPLMPDLRQALGSYFEEFQRAARPAPGQRRHLSVEQPDLVVHSSGRMRSFHGVAYVPALLPPNFSPQDIK